MDISNCNLTCTSFFSNFFHDNLGLIQPCVMLIITPEEFNIH